MFVVPPSSFKIRSKLISGICSHPGHFHEVRVNSKYPALQKINTGRSTCRAFPFLCDLNTVMWKAGLETAHTQSDPDGAALFQRHRKQKTEPLFVPEPLNPLLNTKVFLYKCRAKCCCERTAGPQGQQGSTLHRGSFAIHTHTCNHAYVGAKASVQINLSAKLLHMDSILQETALCLCRLPMTQHTAV